jgi:hypothetical protein
MHSAVSYSDPIKHTNTKFPMSWKPIMDQKISEILCMNVCDCNVLSNARMSRHKRNVKDTRESHLLEESGNILLYF